MLQRSLAVATVLWVLLLAAVVWARQDHQPSGWTPMVYAAASRICHQLPDRSFFTRGVQWPVCARCSGLYLSAPAGALAAILGWRRPRSGAHALWIFVVAALPTAATLGAEWLGMAASSNIVRGLAAVPLGAAIAFLIVTAADGPAKGNNILDAHARMGDSEA